MQYSKPWYGIQNSDNETRILFRRFTKDRIPSQYKDCLFGYRGSHYKDETVVRPSHLYNGNPNTVKTTCLYWDGPWPRHIKSIYVYVHKCIVINVCPIVLIFIQHTEYVGVVWFYQGYCISNNNCKLNVVSDGSINTPAMSQVAKSGHYYSGCLFMFA